MTNQTIPAVTNHDRRLAREWAEHVESSRATWGDRFRAAARVILNAIPTPPTLADMTEEERRECQWMQADVRDFDRRMVVAEVRTTTVGLIEKDGTRWNAAHEHVTPRPDLPRMEWPDADRGGEEVTKVDYVSVAGGRTAYGPWTVARLRKKPAPAPAPPNTLTEGSEWDNVDALARACEESGRDQIVVADKDGDVFVWGVDAEWWETGLPGCDYAPHTIIHAGKKADQ